MIKAVRNLKHRENDLLRGEEAEKEGEVEEEDDAEDSESEEIYIDSAVDDEVKSAEEIEYEVKILLFVYVHLNLV